MLPPVHFVVPFTAIQKRARKGMYGNWYSPSAKDQRMIGEYALAARAKIPLQILSVDVGLSLIVHGLRGDLSNAVKLVEDSMNGVIYYDDAQIVAIQARAMRSGSPSRMEITVSAA